MRKTVNGISIRNDASRFVRHAPRALNSVRTNFRSSIGGDIAMNHTAKTLIVAFSTLALTPIASEAQVRDAASKALGDYSRSGQSQWFGSTPAMNIVVAPTSPAQQPASRAFSYDSRGQAAPCEAATQTPTQQAAKQPTTPQAARRFSYEPGYVVPRATYAPSRGWQSGARDAGSKVRGDY
jgi:hypothetical protein